MDKVTIPLRLHTHLTLYPIKTMGLVVEEREGESKVPCTAEGALMRVRVALSEAEGCNQVERARGVWNPPRQAWELHYDRIRALGLENWFVQGASF